MTIPQPDSAPPAYRLRVSEMASNERPRERLEQLGAQALTTSELLAILLRTGTREEGVLQLAERLQQEHRGLRGLARADIAELSAIRGLGPAKAAAIAAAFELGRRRSLEGEDERPLIGSPEDVVRLLQAQLELLPQEEFRLLALDNRHRVLANRMLSRGSVSSAPVRVAEAFREAVRLNASAITVAHNHPSGDPAPSPDDVETTRALEAGGDLLGIRVLDHVVIGHGRWISMRQSGLGFTSP